MRKALCGGIETYCPTFFDTGGKASMKKTPKPTEQKQKQFVTHNVDGFPNGYELTLRTQLEDMFGSMRGTMVMKGHHFYAHRVTENGILLNASIPAIPACMDAHVRIRQIPVAGKESMKG